MIYEFMKTSNFFLKNDIEDLQHFANTINFLLMIKDENYQ